MSTQALTLPREIRRLAAERGGAVALRQKALGIWQPTTWAELAEAVECIAAALVECGVRPGETVGILSSTCRDWVFSDLGAQGAGAVPAGLHVTEPPERLCAQLSSLGIRVLFVEDEPLFESLALAGDLRQLQHVVVFRTDGLRRAHDARLVGLQEFIARGAGALQADREIARRTEATRAPGDDAAIVYTSGMTDAARPVRLSHRALLAARAAMEGALADASGAPGERLLFLPLSHVMERVGTCYVGLAHGAILNFVEGQDTVFDNLREVQPHVLQAVPRIWERMYSSIAVALNEATPLQQWAYAVAIRLGERIAAARERGKRAPAGTHLAHRLLDVLVLANLRRMMGVDRLRLGLAAGAPVSAELVHWFRAMGVDLRQAWGLAELAGYAAVASAGERAASAGRPLPGFEVRVSAGGELLVRSPTLCSGHADAGEGLPLVEGAWLRTGDIGRIDDEGRVHVVGRSAEVIVTSTGQQVQPAELESRLKASPYIADAVVVGDRRPHLSCLLVPDREAVEQWAQERQVPFSDFRSLCASSELTQLMAQEIHRIGQFGREGIAAFRVIDTSSELDAGALTPALKLKRTRVVERFGDVIESMYAAAAA